MLKSTKAFLLAGASALAILACAAEANAETFTMPGLFSFTASVSGEYVIELLGASGGNTLADTGAAGGLGAEVSGDVFLTAGEDLTLFVGEQGRSAFQAGGGGGGSFVFRGTDVLAVAGGGGGGGTGGTPTGGSPGLAGINGGAGGAGLASGKGGVDGTGGGGGGYYGAGGGAGVTTGSAGYGGNGVGSEHGLGGKFPNGGAGEGGGNFGSGGFGGGGGAGGGGGGGGSGFSGGGGGGDLYGGGGGGSYLASLFTDPVLTGGVNSGDGSISVDLQPAGAVPESSTWAMALTGFAGLGLLARMRKRKLTAA
jgi:hypothetical protein